jgi:outer membrane immunogenic protein
MVATDGGRVMMKSAVAALAFAALIEPAAAADMALPYNKAPPSVTNWSGCYIGADVGAAWTAQDAANTPAPGLDQSGVVGTINGAGGIGGGYAGCNLQLMPVWVVGIEGDFSVSHLGGTVDAANLFANGSAAPTGGVGWTSHLDSIATVRGRVGYVWRPDLLVFITGGAAWGSSSYRSFDVLAGGCPACAVTAFNNTASGYVLGVGLDWALWNSNWIVRAEYLYHSLSGATATAGFEPPLGGAASPMWKDIVVQSARVGLSYKF